MRQSRPDAVSRMAIRASQPGRYASAGGATSRGSSAGPVGAEGQEAEAEQQHDAEELVDGRVADGEGEQAAGRMDRLFGAATGGRNSVPIA